MPDAKYVTELVKRESIGQLMGQDGCYCGHLEMSGVVIEMHCHRSHRSGCEVCAPDQSVGIHVYTNHMDGIPQEEADALMQALVDKMCCGAMWSPAREYVSTSFTNRDGTIGIEDFS